MVDRREVVIRIVEKKKTSGSNGAVSLNPAEVIDNKIDSSSAISNSVKKRIISEAKSTAYELISGAVSFGKDRYFSLKEDYLSENVYDQVSSIVSKGKSFISSGRSGAKIGKEIGGGVGGVVGAVAGVALTIPMQYINYQRRMSSHFQKLNATNAQTSFQAKRAGLDNEGQNTLN